MKVLLIAGTELRRFMRDRSNIFFVFLFPMLLVLLFGLMFGGTISTHVGVVGDEGQLSSGVISAFDEAGFEVVHFESEKTGLGQVERGLITSLVVVDSEAALRVVSQESKGFEVLSAVNSAVSQYTVLRQAEEFIDTQFGSGGVAAVDAVRDLVPPVEVATTLAVGAESYNPFEDYEDPATQFDFGAPQQLVLFTFLTSLASSGALILTKKLGVARRMISTPTPVASVLLGETLGRYFIALLQASFIVLGTALLFGVHWGDPVAVGLLVAVFALVGTAVGMLLGSALNNDQQAGGIGVMLSLSLAALGGAMVPSEIFSDTMKKVAHLTPHSWALDGFREIQFRSGGVADILTELGVLAAAAAVLLVIAVMAFKRRITT